MGNSLERNESLNYTKTQPNLAISSNALDYLERHTEDIARGIDSRVHSDHPFEDDKLCYNSV
jgi:hypothetical protein